VAVEAVNASSPFSPYFGALPRADNNGEGGGSAPPMSWKGLPAEYLHLLQSPALVRPHVLLGLLPFVVPVPPAAITLRLLSHVPVGLHTTSCAG
jgi:hypothetical protein